MMTDRANIELMVIDPYWARFSFKTSIIRLRFPSSMSRRWFAEFILPISPTRGTALRFCRRKGLKIESLDDYIAVIETIWPLAKGQGRGLSENHDCLRENAGFRECDQRNAREKALVGHALRSSPEELKAFEDFIMWRLVELSAKLELPFQIHTGPRAHPGEQPDVAGRPDRGQSEDQIHPVPRRLSVGWRDGRDRHALQKCLDRFGLAADHQFHHGPPGLPGMAGRGASNRIMWGADAIMPRDLRRHEVTRRFLAEALAEKVERGELREDHALRIGRQIMRENALEIFPSLRTNCGSTRA